MKIALYTCITGGYDELLQPLTPDPRFKHICFVDSATPLDGSRNGVWELRALPRSFGNATLDARYPKMHPHELLAEYDYSLWVDANILIKDATIYEAAIAAAERGELYAGVSHPTRDCVYQETRKCRDMHYFGFAKLLSIWLFYFLRGFPAHAGLMENNMIFRDHNNAAIRTLDECWWERVLNWCRRDQLSLPWCLRKCGVKAGYLLPKGVNARNCPGLEYRLHGKR